MMHDVGWNDTRMHPRSRATHVTSYIYQQPNQQTVLQAVRRADSALFLLKTDCITDPFRLAFCERQVETLETVLLAACSTHVFAPADSVGCVVRGKHVSLRVVHAADREVHIGNVGLNRWQRRTKTLATSD